MDLARDPEVGVFVDRDEALDREHVLQSIHTAFRTFSATPAPSSGLLVRIEPVSRPA